MDEGERGEESCGSGRFSDCRHGVRLELVGLSAGAEPAFLGYVVSVALCKTLYGYLQQPIYIKWPNDIYVGDKKICGVLIENRLAGRLIKDSIIGIGLNVNQQEFKSNAPNPVSIKQLTGKDTNREELLKAFLEQLNECCKSTTIIADYGSRLYRREGLHPYKSGNETFKATIVGVKDDGRLVLQNEKGIAHMYRFKEVTFII